MDQTKTLHSCHKNIGLAMADLIEACDQMHHVVNLQRSLESEELQRDWDKFFPCLEQFTAALSYVRAHPTLRSQRDLVAAAEDVRALAIGCLQTQFAQIVDTIPCDTHAPGEEPQEEAADVLGGLQATSERLMELREAMATIGSDDAPILLQVLSCSPALPAPCCSACPLPVAACARASAPHACMLAHRSCGRRR
jgi:hypothetical protein